MNKSTKYAKAATCLISALWVLGLAGCSSSTPAPESASTKGAVMNFNLDTCQQLEPGLYKCPAIDKPICNPDYAGSSVECVRVGKKGSVFVQQLEQ
jgi:hypothetical protein